MSEKKYSNQPRKPQSIVGKIAEYGDTAINTLVGGIGVAGGFAANELRKLKKFQDKQRKLRQQAHMKRFLEKKNKRVKKTTPPGRGGGGGTYNVAQPIADKNLMNKYGKKLK